MASASSSARRHSVRYRDRTYDIVARTELATAGVAPWCLEVNGGWYCITADERWLERDARRFVREQLTNNHERTPGLTASKRFPLLLSINRIVVKAWPAFIARNRGAATYVNPATGDRVAAVKDQIYWTFESTGRPATAFGTMSGEQSIDDVRDLATIWLRLPTDEFSDYRR